VIGGFLLRQGTAILLLIRSVWGRQGNAVGRAEFTPLAASSLAVQNVSFPR
jgi:hypothetical protein